VLLVSLVFLPALYHADIAFVQLALQWHYRILQALALDEDLPEHPEDKTIPKYRQIDKVSQYRYMPIRNYILHTLLYH
jgi:ATP-dependent DNA helicase 2 subunit 1